MNGKAEEAAAALRESSGVNDYPVNPAAIAEKLGVEVVRATMEDQLSGMLVRDGEHLAIGVNRKHSRTRQAFTIAHELGHLTMHRGRPLIVDSSVRLNFRDRTSAAATNREEMEANAFAAALLMPVDLVLDAAGSLHAGEDPEQAATRLAKRFGVSTQAMQYRLINLGVFSSF